MLLLELSSREDIFSRVQTRQLAFQPVLAEKKLRSGVVVLISRRALEARRTRRLS
jgi:hypothetical protein